MKKYGVIILSLLLLLGVLSGCNKNPDEDPISLPTEPEEIEDKWNPHDEEIDVYIQNETIALDENDVEEYEVLTSEDGKYTLKQNAINGFTLLSVPEDTTGEFTVPTKIDDKTITKVGDKLLANNSSLTKVIVPDGILIIGEYSFMNCPNLESVEIAGSVLKVREGAFVNDASLTDIKFSNGLIEIGDSVFAGCGSLSTVTLPDSLEVIGIGGFSYSGLTSIVLPEHITSIQDRTFCGCSKLKTVTMGPTMRDIMDSAFANCTELEITVESCEKICATAFDNVKKANYNKDVVYQPYDLSRDQLGTGKESE